MENGKTDKEILPLALTQTKSCTIRDGKSSMIADKEILPLGDILRESYTEIRRICRDDGDSFFRSFIFSYMEGLLELEENEEDPIVANLAEWKDRLTPMPFPRVDFGFATDELLEMVANVRNKSWSIEQLLETFGHHVDSTIIMLLLRKITSLEMQHHPKLYKLFTRGINHICTVYELSTSKTEDLGKDCGFVQVKAFSDALGVPIRLVYLEKGNEEGGSILKNEDFVPHGVDPAARMITLLWKSRGYDILYAK